MSTLYPYSISNDITAGAVSIDKLHIQIKALLPNKFEYINTEGDSLSISFSATLTGPELTSLNSLILNHTVSSVGQKNYYIEEYDAGKKMTAQSWYNTDNGNGTYTGLVAKTIYAYTGSTLISRTEKEYWLDGTERSSDLYSYFKSGNNVIIKKV